MKKTVCYFGSYDKRYSRNRLNMKAFRFKGWSIVECNDRSVGLGHYLKLIKKYFEQGKDADVIFIGFLGHFDVWMGWLLSRISRKKLIFDAFYSLFDTYIEDRKLYSKKSLAAIKFYFYDWLSVSLADRVILDTQENIKYFKKYNQNKNKFFELPVTADPEIFKFNPPSDFKEVRLGFYGSFLPLHGIENIVDAINIIKNEKVKLFILGSGQMLDSIKKKIKKLSLGKYIEVDERLVPYETLPKFYKKINLFLAGPFGKTEKASRVVTAKTIESLSVGLPTVVVETPATLVILKDVKEKIIWIKDSNPKTIARAIQEFYNNPPARFFKKNDNFSRSNLNFKNYASRLVNIVNIQHLKNDFRRK